MSGNENLSPKSSGKVEPIIWGKNALSILFSSHGFCLNLNLFLLQFIFVIFLVKFYFLLLSVLCWVFTAVRGLSLVGASRGYSLVVVPGLRLLQSTGSRHVSLSICGAWALLPCDMWNLPRPGIEQASPALAGRSLTTGSPRKSQFIFVKGLLFVYRGT